jgi:hypothetical protein
MKKLLEEVHVLPSVDTYPHLIGTMCPCKPVVEVHRKTLMVTHFAFDGRDILEFVKDEYDIDNSGDHGEWENIKIIY